MDDKIVEFPGNYGTEIEGPFPGERYFVIVGGYKVPHLELRKEPDQSEWDWCMVIDDRLGHLIKTQELFYWAPAIANAMAVAAGYSCFGENCQPANPFKVRFGMLSAES